MHSLHKQAEEALAERIKQLEAVRAVTEEITRELDLTTLLNLITQRAVELVAEGASGAVSLWDEAGQILVSQAWYNQGEWRRELRRKLGEGISGTVAQRREGMILNDYRNSPYVNPFLVQRLGTTALLAEPLVYRDRLLGVIVISNGRTGRLFTAQDRELLRLFAAQAAIAIENARLFAEVQKQKDELETRVEERTAELRLANGQLRQEITERQRAEEALQTFTAQLQQSNRELQDFAYVASHDLQEPLRKIQTFGDRLQAKCSEALSEQGRDYLERMQNAAQRMHTLITDLLAFSRVTTKAQPFVPVDLAKVAREVVADLEVRLEQTGGRVEVADLPTIDADPTQMRQLLQNLIGNALKFRRVEEASVVRVHGQRWLSQEQCSTTNAPVIELCQIVVADNGIGFDEKYLDRIFNVFQRLHSRTAYEGTGIGLAVCRKIVERHRGSITAHSTPGQGATFIVTLPVTHSEEGHVECIPLADLSLS